MSIGSLNESSPVVATARVAVEATRIWKTFRLPHQSRMSIKDYVFHPLTRTTHEEQRALQDVSLSIDAGEFLGVIGPNGSGKSTLLKILAGIYEPDRGSVRVNGLLSPFIELGVGFNPDLNARDNIRINAVLLGLTEQELEERFDEIVAFAELQRFVDQKLRNYSSGMRLRLAFAIAIQVPFDILLLDEVLAVGDQSFQEKCFAQFEDLRRQQKTVILVTHSLPSVTRFCDRALLLRGGVVEVHGAPEDVVERYSEEESRRVRARRQQEPDGGPSMRAAIAAREALSQEVAGLLRTQEERATDRGHRLVALQTALKQCMKERDVVAAVADDRAALVAETRRLYAVASREAALADAMLDSLIGRHYAAVPIPPDDVRRIRGRKVSKIEYLAKGLHDSEEVLAVFGERPHGPILEIGCGSGSTFRWLEPWQAWRDEYHGCDEDAELVEWLGANTRLGVRLCTEAPTLPYSDGFFRGAFATTRLKTIHPTQQPDWYGEVRRILEPGSLLYLAADAPSLVKTAAWGRAAEPALREHGWAFLDESPKGPRAVVTADYTRAVIDGLFSLETYRERGSMDADQYVLRAIP
jgi:ABC-type polysaccharide/polyol phosphate transport system ATPase subunit